MTKLKLEDRHIEFISHIINKSGIQSTTMKEDLIDHFCCAIEEDLKKGFTFEESYDKAYHNICPDGFDEIHRETVFLLTSKKIKTMKRLLYVSGYLSAIGITITLFLKLNHMAGGGISLVLTSAIVVFVFLPTLFLYLYRRKLTKTGNDKLSYIFGFLGITLLLLAVLFHVLHWPGMILLFFMAVFIVNFAFLPLLFLKMYRKTIE